MASSLTLTILGIFVVYLCYLQIEVIKHSRDKNERNYSKILLILFILANFWFYINVKISYPLDIALLLGYSLMIAFFKVYNLLSKYIFNSETEMGKIDEEFQKNKGNLHEFLRKFFHFFVFGGSLLYIVIYNTVSVDVISNDQSQNQLIGNYVFWDNLPILRELNFNFRFDPLFYQFSAMQTAMITLFMIALPLVIIVERYRLDPQKEIPFHILFIKSLRPDEKHNAAHYYFFTFGIFLAAAFLPVAYVFGILCILCFGDTFAGLVGKRCQRMRHKIPWESEKCFEGSIAGFLATFFTSIFFVGWVMGVVLSLVFILIDIITPYTLKVSDNFAYPLISIGIIVIVLLVGFQAPTMFGEVVEGLNKWYANNLG
ncbi:MAG: hypothetical protein R6U96_14050 [Promethearchaeia archaeon]